MTRAWCPLVKSGWFVAALILTVCFTQRAAADSSAPARGIHADFTGPFTASSATLIEGALSRSDVTGLSFYVPWYQFEPSEDHYDWTYIDEAINIATAQNKPVSFGIEVASFGTPEWLKDKCHTFTYTHYVPSVGRQVAPVPWDPYYLKKLTQAIDALGKRYNGNSNITYMTIVGPATLWGTETNWSMKRGSISPEDLTTLGFSLDRYVDTWDRMIDIYFDAFPNTDLALALNDEIDIGNYSKGQMLAAIKSIRSHALSKQASLKPRKKMWMRLLGLEAGAPGSSFFTGPYDGQPDSLTPYVRLLWDVHREAHTAFEMARIWSLTVPPTPPQKVRQALQTGLSFDPDLIEVKIWDLWDLRENRPYERYAPLIRRANSELMSRAPSGG